MHKFISHKAIFFSLDFLRGSGDPPLMRLLRVEEDGSFSLVERVGNNVPSYAVLSHTWGTDEEEVTFRDMMDGTGKTKLGYRKIQFCGKQASVDGLRFFWVDTCCIDKSSSAELEESINSMFRWYRDAARCYVFLPDVSGLQDDVFERSRWFTRGWTLQELVAPASVEFFSISGDRLGDKKSLEPTLYKITGIAVEALRGAPLSNFTVDERLSWAANRQTKREEDAAYSLLGIFGIHMPAIYGEGKQNALERLLRKIRKRMREQNSPLNANFSLPASLAPTAPANPPNIADRSSLPSHSPTPADHPVKGNYRKVHMTIIHWQVDEVDYIVSFNPCASSCYIG